MTLRRVARRLRGASLASAIAASCALATTPAPSALAAPTRKLPPGVSLEASTDRPNVELGDVVTYQLQISVSNAQPLSISGFDPGAVPGFELLGRPSTSTMTQQTLVGRAMRETTTVTIRWQLRAKSLGEHVLGPAHVGSDEATWAAPAVKVNVVARGLAPAPTRPKAHSFFDDDVFEPPPIAQEPDEPVDPLAKVGELPDAPADREVFLRVVVDPSTLVVGAQTTAHVFVYAHHLAEVGLKRPPEFTDFAALELSKPEKSWKPITIAGQSWVYAKLQSFAIFPLKTGALTIGPAQIESVYADGFHMRGVEQDHDSAPVTVTATEPPEQGRPAEYRVGDVASELAVSADVAPRTSADGHAMVTVRLSGVGRLQNVEPLMPRVAGVSFTRTTDQAKTWADGARVRSRREVIYDASADRAGRFSLGEARVLVWDPARSTYATASAQLGVLEAKAASAAAPSSSANAEPTLELPPPRTDPGERGEGTSLADRALIWVLVGGAPLLVLSLQGAARATRSLRRRAKSHREDPTTRAHEALREARDHERRGDGKQAAACLARAIGHGVEAATRGAVHVRGMTGSELRRELPDAGFEASLAERIATTLGALEAARFAGARAPRADEVAELLTAIASCAPTETP